MAQKKKLITIQVKQPEDINQLQNFLKGLSGKMAIDETTAGQIVLAATELAGNLLYHRTVNNRIVISSLRQQKNQAIEIESIDEGPGIRNLRLALTDGYSTLGTTGTGLGAVNRLMDEFEITSYTRENARPPAQKIGTHVVCRKWLPVKAHHFTRLEGQMKFSILTRPRYGEKQNGDAYLIAQDTQSTFVALIDALGHGPEAARAAATAVDYLKKHYREEPGQLIKGTHEACRGTRGVVMAVCRIDHEKNQLRYAGIGNILLRGYTPSGHIQPANLEGILGLTLRRVKVHTHPWPGGLIIMFTDGIKPHWNHADIEAYREAPVVTLTDYLFHKYSRWQDDATILVGK